MRARVNLSVTISMYAYIRLELSAVKAKLGPLTPCGHRYPLLNQQRAKVGFNALGVRLELSSRLLWTQPAFAVAAGEHSLCPR